MEHPVDEKSEDQLLVEYLGTRDVACPRCAYNLRGLTSSRCPECGKELQLNVAVLERSLKAWITLAASVAAAAGVGVLFLCLIRRLGWPPYMRFWGNIGTFYCFAAPVLLWPVVGFRRKFVWLSPPAQWLIAGIAVALSSTALACI